jgi:hypothetical protein
MRAIAFVVCLAACGNPARREVEPLAPQPAPIPAANDKDILTPTPALVPPDAPPSGSSANGAIHISVEADGGIPIDGAALPPLPDAVVPDAGSPMQR